MNYKIPDVNTALSLFEKKVKSAAQKFWSGMNMHGRNMPGGAEIEDIEQELRIQIWLAHEKINENKLKFAGEGKYINYINSCIENRAAYFFQYFRAQKFTFAERLPEDKFKDG